MGLAWSALTRVSKTLAKTGPKGRKEVGAPEHFSAVGWSEPHAPSWALALP